MDERADAGGVSFGIEGARCGGLGGRIVEVRVGISRAEEFVLRIGGGLGTGAGDLEGGAAAVELQFLEDAHFC